MAKREITIQELYEATKDTGAPLMQMKWIVDAFPTFNGAETIQPHYCEEASLPFPQIAEKSKTIAATNIFFPGGSQVQPFDMVLYEDQKARSMRYILNWQSKIQNPSTGGYYPASFYKRDLKFLLLNDQNEVILEGIARNAWPLGIQPLQLTYSSNDRHKLSLNVACDAFVPLPV